MRPKLEWKIRRSGLAPDLLRNRFGDLSAQLLWSRGFDDLDSAESYLSVSLAQLSSPFLILNMNQAAERVCCAIETNEPIAIYADYDIDGMSGLAILATFFRKCGATKITTYQPDRLQEGYGVHPLAIEQLYQQGNQLILTVDTGTSAHAAAEVAVKLGVDLIVTDHHQQIGDIPSGICVVNPNQKGDTSPLKQLSGTGMAFYLAMAVRSLLRQKNFFNESRKEPDLREWLDLFTLGTIADQVEISGDNRPLLKAGLNRLNSTQRPGLAALIQRCLSGGTVQSARDVGFSITPKLNAASRMGQAALSTELLITESAERGRVLAEEILELNRQRSEIQAVIFEEAVQQAEQQPENSVIVVCGKWHEGVLGIVAAKIVDLFHRPTIVLSELGHEESTVRGSMRTIPGVSCMDVLGLANDLLLKWGGHEMAAGLQLKKENFLSLQKRLGNFSASNLDTIVKPVFYDGALSSNNSPSVQEIETLNQLGPWGSGNPEPLFLIEKFSLSKLRLLKQSHVKGLTENGTEVIGFFKASELNSMKDEGISFADLLIRPEINRFQGREGVQFRIEYARPCVSLDSSVGS